MFEHKRESLISRSAFRRRLGKYVGIAAGILGLSLGVGALGYHLLEGFTWVDSVLNASMILGGMGPVATLQSVGGKIFASLYALYAGIVFLVVTGVVLAPVLHRFLHRFHIESEDRQSRGKPRRQQ